MRREPWGRIRLATIMATEPAIREREREKRKEEGREKRDQNTGVKLYLEI